MLKLGLRGPDPSGPRGPGLPLTDNSRQKNYPALTTIAAPISPGPGLLVPASRRT